MLRYKQSRKLLKPLCSSLLIMSYSASFRTSVCFESQGSIPEATSKQSKKEIQSAIKTDVTGLYVLGSDQIAARKQPKHLYDSCWRHKIVANKIIELWQNLFWDKDIKDSAAPPAALGFMANRKSSTMFWWCSYKSLSCSLCTLKKQSRDCY